MNHFRILSLLGALLLFVGNLESQVLLRTEFFLPQIADGTIDEEEDERDVFRTILIFNNPNMSGPASVTLSMFAQDGTGLEMPFRCLEVSGPCTSFGQTVSTDSSGNLSFMIPEKGLVELMTARTNPVVVVGYGRVTSDIAISGSALFGQFEEEFDEEEQEVEVEIEGQAAVEATGKMTRFAVTDFRKNEFEGEVMGVEFEFESESATGLAVVNVSQTTATTLTLTEFDASGATVLGAEATLMLNPGEHRSFFLSEVLTVPENFIVGTVVVESSDTEVTAVALKFDGESDDQGEARSEFTASPVIQLAP